MYKQNSQPVNAAFFVQLFVPFALAFFMSCLLRTINSVLAPTFIETFNMSASDLGIMTSAYFLSFAVAQIPLGVFFDRFGPSRTLSFSLLFAVIGCIVFASAQTMLFLFIGRALVGLGVAGCMIAAYKAFGDWLPKDKLPIFNSMESFVGGIGGIVATAPINAALSFINWRTVFLIFAGLTFLSAVIVFFAPNKKGNTNESIGRQFTDAFRICLTGRFWRLAPLAILGQSAYLALNSLWIGPWYKDVMNVPGNYVPQLLLICACVITIGYFFNGIIANRLKKHFTIPVYKTVIFTMTIYTVILFFIALLPQLGKIWWPFFVLLGPFSLLTYPIFSDLFRNDLAGRAQAVYNMLVFVLSMVIQSGIGYIIDMYEPTSDGGYNPAGYATAFLILASLLALSILWAIFFRRKEHELKY